MMKKILLFALLFLAIITVIERISLIISNFKNQVDISDLEVEDYIYLTEEKNHQVYLFKDGTYKQVRYKRRPIRSIELSPSLSRSAFFYYPNDTESEEISLIVYNKQKNVFKEVYHTDHPSWDVRSKLHWLGDDYIFFLSHCGTACQGITLLDIKSGKTKSAVLTFPSFPNQQTKTHFKDWFGQDFVMNGLVSDLDGTSINNSPYLIFTLKDYAGNFLTEERLQFVESRLEEQ